jgi:hypothetical protein
MECFHVKSDRIVAGTSLNGSLLRRVGNLGHRL